MNKILLWPLKRDDHSGVLIGAGGKRCSDWPARVRVDDEVAESWVVSPFLLYHFRPIWRTYESYVID